MSNVESKSLEVISESLTVITEIEAQYPQTCEEFKRIQQADYLVFCKKQRDYGPSNISIGFSLTTPEEVRASQSGIVFRLNDKVRRLLNLIVLAPKEFPANESIEDSWLDTSIYGIIARIVKNGKWGK